MSGPTCWEDQLLRLWGYLVIIFLMVSYVHFLFSPVEILFSSNVSALLSLLLRIFAFPAQKANITIRVTGPSFPSTDNKRIPCLRLCGSHLFSFFIWKIFRCHPCLWLHPAPLGAAVPCPVMTLPLSFLDLNCVRAHVCADILLSTGP